MLMNGEGPFGDERLWKGVMELAMAPGHIHTLYEAPIIELVKQNGEAAGVIAK